MTLQWLDEAPAMLPLHLPGQCLEALVSAGLLLALPHFR